LVTYTAFSTTDNSIDLPQLSIFPSLIKLLIHHFEKAFRWTTKRMFK